MCFFYSEKIFAKINHDNFFCADFIFPKKNVISNIKLSSNTDTGICGFELYFPMDFITKTVSDSTEIKDEQQIANNSDEDSNDAIICGDCTIIPPNREEDNTIITSPIDRIVYPCDIVEISDDDEIIYIIGTKDGKVTKIKGLENNRKLKVQVLRYISKLLNNNLKCVCFLEPNS